jgi:assimilatory nitrate reductase catalytic subunit
MAVPFGREPGEQVGLLFRAAAAQPQPGRLAVLEAALGLVGGPVLRYADARAGQHRAMRLGADGSLQAFLLAGNARAQAWVLALLQQGGSAASFGRALLAASLKPPLPLAPRSPQVCACFDVSEAAITTALAACEGSPDERLAALQGRLHCGTQCGSCVPRLKQLLQQVPQAAAAV